LKDTTHGLDILAKTDEETENPIRWELKDLPEVNENCLKLLQINNF
jgi:hypothetical protein